MSYAEAILTVQLRIEVSDTLIFMLAFLNVEIGFLNIVIVSEFCINYVC